MISKIRLLLLNLRVAVPFPPQGETEASVSPWRGGGEGPATRRLIVASPLVERTGRTGCRDCVGPNSSLYKEQNVSRCVLTEDGNIMLF